MKFNYDYQTLKNAYIAIKRAESEEKSWKKTNVKQICDIFDEILPFEGLKKDLFYGELSSIKYNKDMPSYVWAQIYRKAMILLKDEVEKDEKLKEFLEDREHQATYNCNKEAILFNGYYGLLNYAKENSILFVNRETFIHHVMNMKLYNGTTDDLIKASASELDKLAEELMGQVKYIIV